MNHVIKLIFSAIYIDKIEREKIKILNRKNRKNPTKIQKPKKPN